MYGAHDNWTAQEWDPVSHDKVGRELQHGGIVKAVAVSRDGRLLATGSADRSVRVWDAATHEPIAGTFWHAEPVTAVAFLPDAMRVVSGSEDGTARIWDCGANTLAGSPMRHAKAIRAVGVSPDGSRIITGSDDETARVWSVATTAPLCEALRHEGAVRAVAFSPDGTRFFTASAALYQWDAVTLEAMADPMHHGASILCAHYSPDGETIVSACEDQTLRVWDVGSGQLAAPRLKLDRTIRSLAFHPGSERFFAGHSDGSIREWKLPVPLPDEPQRLRAWVEVATTHDSTKSELARLSWQTWIERQEELLASGGPFRRHELASANEWPTEHAGVHGRSLVAKTVVGQQRLKKIVQAMTDLAQKEGKLPARANFSPAGQPLLSWRVHL
ncbi:MAG: WD40 repeat domain-containing protein, partial [Pirellulales bacterium]